MGALKRCKADETKFTKGPPEGDEYSLADEYQNIRLLNTQLLSGIQYSSFFSPDVLAIYNDTLVRKDEQNNFMKIIAQLSEVVKELKEQKNMNNCKIKPSLGGATQQKIVSNPKAQSHRAFQNSSPVKSNSERNDEDECDDSFSLNDMPKFHVGMMSSWDKVFKGRHSDGNESYVTNSGGTVVSVCSSIVDFTHTKQKSRPPACKQHKIYGERFKIIYKRLKKHEQYMSKTKTTFKQLEEQGKSLIFMVEELKVDQEKEKEMTEILVNRIEDMAKAEICGQNQKRALNILEIRIKNVENVISESSSRGCEQDKLIASLRDELKAANSAKDDQINKNYLLSLDISDMSSKLVDHKKQIEQLVENVKQEKAHNETMKQSYEVHLKHILSNKMQEQRNSSEDMKNNYESRMKVFQEENEELKTKISEMEDDWKKLMQESKIRAAKAKRHLHNQVGIASHKLIHADSKIKEFYLTIEKLLRGIYLRMYEGQLSRLKRRCEDEGGVQAATQILGVTTAQMTRVLAADAFPTVTDWLEACKRLAYKDKFADDLATFVLSLFRPVSPKDIMKGAGDF